jgi:autoinducer 2-degrading protein
MATAKEDAMLTFTARLTVQAGQEAEFERIMRAAVPKVREEPGNRTYVLHRSTENPCVFMFYEEYEDQAALEAHRAHLRVMGIDLCAMLDGQPTLEFYEKLV